LDVAGEVVSVGADVKGFQPGERVAALVGGGGYAEYAVASAILTWPIPDEIDTETAAAFPLVGVTSFNLLHMAGRLAAGETVLIHAAAGGVGSTLVQLARLLGAGKIIGTVGDDSKIDLAIELGCHHVINYRREDFVDSVQSLTKEAGANLVLDGIGGSIFERSVDCLATFGRIVVYGFAGGTPGVVDAGTLQAWNREVIGYSTTTLRRLRPSALRPAGDAVLKCIQRRELRMIIGARFDLGDAASAHRMVESRASVGKVLHLP
jgi:NADPH2:quinone reductase